MFVVRGEKSRDNEAMTEKKKPSKKTSKVSVKKAAPEVNPDARQIVPLLPLRDIVIFPHMVVPFFVGREKSINALEAAMRDKTDILLCAQKNSTTNNPGIE